jgi:hypothetical protein
MRTHRFRHAAAATTLAVIVSGGALELGVRLWMPQFPLTEPAHDVLFLTPDRTVGWKHPESFTFFWNGRNPYCIEFRVPVTTNNFGFRDHDWRTGKAADTVRIAVLGDSFIEAIQVPLEQTSTRLLERLLTARFPGKSLETLNFGVSNYSVGQYLILYDEYVRRFQPDYVVVFASYLNFTRTTQRELSSRLQEFYALNVRPTFAVGEQGVLRYVPAEDYDDYVHGVSSLLTTYFDGNRTAIVAPIRSPLALPHWMLHVLSRKARAAPTPHERTNTTFPDLELNYRILEALHRRVASDQATLVFADAFEYLERYGLVRGSGALASRNQAFIEGLGASYVDLSPALRASPTNPQYECDLHFNEMGNRVIAETLAAWFEAPLAARWDATPNPRF